MENLVKIKLHNKLGKEVGENWELAVNSVSEAVRAIEIMSGRKLYKFLHENDKKGLKYRVLINGDDFLYDELPTAENPKAALNSQLVMKVNNLKTIDIVPVIEGSDSDILGIILGVILIVVGIALIPFTGPGGALISIKGGALIGGALIIGGLGLLAGGVMGLLSSPPSFEDFRDINNKQGNISYLFNGPQNTTREGGPVPIGYGRLLVGSHTIAASYVVSDVANT